VGVLKGAFVFLSDLIRHVPGDLTLDFIAVSSYLDGTTASGEVRVLTDLEFPIAGRHVVIVEDIVDTGMTLTYLQGMMRARNPRSLATACLLNKPSRRKMEVTIDYVGFTIDDRFVVGYGLDHAERYRNLPYIATISS
jgi:hypoxanthine phosphoribosyltransferase